MRSPRFFITAAVVVLVPVLSFGQVSAFQSGDGQTSLYIDSGATIINLTDTKFSIGYTNRHSASNFFYGFELFGKSSSGVTTLFSSKGKIPEGGGDFIIGWMNPLKLEGKAVRADWFLLDSGYSRAGFYVAPGPAPIDNARRYLDRYRFIGAYNALVNGTLLLGVAAGAERRNNLGDLKSVTFQTTLIPAADGSQDSVVKTQAGFLGAYRQYVAAPIYTDALFMLPPSVTIPGFDSQIGIDVFTRSDAARVNRSFDGGAGIFLSKKGAPTKVLGGLSASWNHGKVKVALVAGFNF